MIFFTSDLHFAHDRQFLFVPRGFKNIAEHNEAIIERWNRVVSPEDTVYILGDLMLNDNAVGAECLKRLNGVKYFVRGNHDTDARLSIYLDAGLIYLGDASRLKYNGYHFYLSHYPTLTGNLEAESLKKCTLNLFGHTHSKEKFFEDRPYMYNIALDAHNCYPVEIEQIIKDMKNAVEECKEML